MDCCVTCISCLLKVVESVVMVHVDPPPSLVVQLAQPDLGLDVPLVSQELVVFYQIVVQHPAGVAPVVQLVLESDPLYGGTP